MKLFFALNSFKSSISNIECYYLTKKIFSDKHNTIFPISDGGDGFFNMIKFFLRGKLIYENTIDAENKKIKIPIIIVDNNIYIESADIIGIKNIKNNIPLFQRHTKGIGIIVKKYIDNYNIFIGLGGSSTVDIGAGFLEQLNAKIDYIKNTTLPERVDLSYKYNNIYGIYDVNNYLEGDNGAIIYAYQKGLIDRQEEELKNIFNNISFKYNLIKKPGSGSAGGLGAAILLMGGNLIHNFLFLNKICNLKKHIKQADAIITNEGVFDNQSFNGKITGIIVNMAIKMDKRVFIITGKSMIKNNKIKIIQMGEQAIKKPEYYFTKSLYRLKEMI